MAQSADEKAKNGRKFVQTGRGRRQDHGSKGNVGDKGFDEREWKVSSNERRDARHGGEEKLVIEVVEEVE